jgi:hypothetical protein
MHGIAFDHGVDLGPLDDGAIVEQVLGIDGQLV